MPNKPVPTTIRLARPEDHAAVTGIVAAAYGRFVPVIGRKPGPMLDDYAALIAAGAVHVLVAGPAIVGLLVLLAQPDALLLDNVAVDPAAQGGGHGRTLLEFAEQQARAAGRTTLRLYTNAAMTENLAWYARQGFTETHRAVEHGLHRVYMEKPLL